MKSKLITYPVIVAVLATAFVSPALAQQTYNFGPEGTNITWQQLWDSSYEKAIPQTATLTFLTTIINTRRTFFVKEVAEIEVVRKMFQAGLRDAAEKQLAKTIGKVAAKKTAEKISVKFGGAFVPGLNIALAVETVFEVAWPADVNWQARGYPMLCINKTIDSFPSCPAYLISQQPKTMVLWA